VRGQKELEVGPEFGFGQVSLLLRAVVEVCGGEEGGEAVVQDDAFGLHHEMDAEFQ
jgi:hypothetical protein